MQVKWTGPALKALERVQDDISTDNPKTAFEVAQKIRHATEQLSYHPKLGRAGRVDGTYELVILSLQYIVAYRVEGKEVHILSMYHPSRKWP